MKTVTVFGGGTGSYVVLSALKQLQIKLNAIVNMMDSGGSTGKLRDQLGVLPPGDLRQCLVALAEESNLWRKLFLYRFESGDLAGHNFGNILISALEKIAPSYDQVLDAASRVLKTKGKVIPVTLDRVHLIATYSDGTEIMGEGLIDNNSLSQRTIQSLRLEPFAHPNPKAIQAITNADAIIFSPGDLYTSLLPLLLVDHIKETIQNSSAKLIYIVNLMTRSGQTIGYTASTHIRRIEEYAGRAPDVVVMNNGSISDEVLSTYKAEGEYPVVNDLNGERFKGEIVEADLIDTTPYTQATSDVVHRSLLRHDPQKLLTVLSPYLL